MKTKKALLIVASFVLTPHLLWAQAKSGDGEVSLSGFLNTSLGGNTSTTAGFAQVGFGKFVGDRTEITFGPSFQFSSGSAGGGTNVTVGGSFAVKQYFGGGKTVFPYVGLDLNITSFTAPDNGDILDNTYTGLNLGFKNYFKPNVALDVKAALGFLPKDFGGTKNLGLVVGISYIF